MAHWQWRSDSGTWERYSNAAASALEEAWSRG